MTDSRAFNIYTSETLTLRLEYSDSLAILHCPKCSKLNKAVLKEINEAVFELFMFVKTVGFENLHAAAPEDNPLVNKVASLTGFKFLETSQGLNIYTYGG